MSIDNELAEVSIDQVLPTQPEARVLLSGPRQRIRQSCNQCRQNKKKCDQSKPMCGRCIKYGLTCNFASTSSTEGHSPTESVDSGQLVLPLRPSMSIEVPGFTSSTDLKMLDYLLSYLGPRMAPPSLPPGSSDISDLISSLLGCRWAICSVLAFASLHASVRQKVPRAVSLRYAQSAIEGLYDAIAKDRVQRNLRKALHGVAFLCLFEAYYPDSRSFSLAHAIASGKLLSMRFAYNESTLDLDVWDSVNLVMMLMNLSAGITYSLDPEQVEAALPRDAIQNYIEQITRPQNDSMQLSIPLAKMKPSLYLLIFDVSLLCRRASQLDEKTRIMKAEEYRQTIIDLESSVNENYRTVMSMLSSGSVCTLQQRRSVDQKIILLGLHLLLNKICDLEGVTCNSPSTIKLLQEAFYILQVHDAGSSWASFTSWSLNVFGCAACPINALERDRYEGGCAATDTSLGAFRYRTRQLISQHLNETHHKFQSGTVWRAIKLLERIWSLPNDIRHANVPANVQVDDDTQTHDGLIALMDHRLALMCDELNAR